MVNLINEATEAPTDAQRRDLQDAHALDPSLGMTSRVPGARTATTP
jgi:hypothetical protein